MLNLFLLATTVEVPSVAMAATGLTALAFLAWLIRQTATIKGYIREAAGVKDAPGERRIVDQPLIVAEEKRMATREELDQVAQTVDKIEDDMKGMRGEISAMEHRMASDLEKRVVDLHRRIDVMQMDVHQVPARTLALLKDTKGLLP